jgi:hypothetical protein
MKSGDLAVVWQTLQTRLTSQLEQSPDPAVGTWAGEALAA